MSKEAGGEKTDEDDKNALWELIAEYVRVTEELTEFMTAHP